MPTLLRLTQKVYEEFLGEPWLADFSSRDRFHPGALVLNAVLDAAREVAGLLAFPRRTWEFATVAGQVEEVFVPPAAVDASVPWRVGRVLQATYGGLSVPMGSLNDVLHYQQHAASSFPRFWYWDERQTDVVGEPRLRWGPASSGVGTWTLEVVADELLSQSIALGVLVEPDGVMDADGLTDPLVGLQLDELHLWSGAYQQWTHVALNLALMKLHLKERNLEQVSAYGSLYRSGLREFAESIGVRIPGAVEEAAA